MGTPRDGRLLCRPTQPSGALKSRSAGGLGACPLTCGLLPGEGQGQGRRCLGPNPGSALPKWRLTGRLVATGLGTEVGLPAASVARGPLGTLQSRRHRCS